MTEIVNSFEHAGLTVQIHHDSDGYSMNPRENFEPFGTMVFWNIDGYDLGGDNDETHRDELDFEQTCEACGGSGEDEMCPELPPAGPFGQFASCQPCEGNGYVTVSIEDYFRKEYDAAIIVPLHFADYGSNGTRMTRDDFDDCNGVIFLTRTELDKEYSKDWLKQQGKETDDEIREFIEEQLMAHVKEYDNWGQGNVFGYVIAGPTVEDEDERSGKRVVDLEDVPGFHGALHDSCWGFIGEYDDPYLEGEAKQAAEHIRAEIDKELAESRFWMEREVTTR